MEGTLGLKAGETEEEQYDEEWQGGGGRGKMDRKEQGVGPRWQERDKMGGQLGKGGARWGRGMLAPAWSLEQRPSKFPGVQLLLVSGCC